MRGKVATCVKEVQLLSQVALYYPQTAHVGFSMCMQPEWQYVQIVVADKATFFEPLEEAICMDLIPALLGLTAGEHSLDDCQVMTHGVRMGGMGNRNPTETTPRVHQTLLDATSHLTASIVDALVEFNLDIHSNTARGASKDTRTARLEGSRTILTAVGRIILQCNDGTNVTVRMAHGSQLSPLLGMGLACWRTNGGTRSGFGSILSR